MNDSTFQSLLNSLHDAQKNKNQDKEIEALLKIAEYHYNNSNLLKAKLTLKEIQEINPSQVNVNYYLALIEIHENNYHKAIKLLNKELKINHKNKLALELKHKLNIHENFPIITIFLFLISLLTFSFTYPQITISQSIKYGASYTFLDIFSGISSLFFHINLYHFLFNMIILISFGLILEKNIGSLKFLFIYLISGIGGNLFEVSLIHNEIILGASAALFGILGAIMMREPLLKLRIFGIIKIPLIFVLGSFLSISFILNSLFKITLITGDIAHFTGLFLGILTISLMYQNNIEIFYNWIFITFGFIILEYSIKNLIIKNLFINNIILNILLIAIGLFLISYSYIKLKMLISFGGINNETDN